MRLVIILTASTIAALICHLTAGHCSSEDALRSKYTESLQNEKQVRKEYWTRLAQLKREMEASLLDGSFAIAAEKQSTVVKYANSNFGSTHWVSVEADLNLKHLQNLCELNEKDMARAALAMSRLTQMLLNKSEGNYDAAVQDGNEVLAVLGELGMTSTPLYSKTLGHVAKSYQANGDNDSAFEYYTRNIELLRELYKGGHPEAIRQLTDFAAARMRSPRFWEAEHDLREALNQAEEYRKQNPSDPRAPADLVASSQNLADFCYTLECTDESLQLYKTCLDIIEKNGKLSTLPDVIIRLSLARAYLQAGESDNAVLQTEYVLRLIQGNLGNTTERALIRLSLADFFMRLNQLENARNQLKLARAEVGDSHSESVGSLIEEFHLVDAQIARHEGRLEEAESNYSKGLELLEQQLGPEHPQLMDLLGEYASVEDQLGHDAEAGNLRSRSKRIATRISAFRATRAQQNARSDVQETN